MIEAVSTTRQVMSPSVSQLTAVARRDALPRLPGDSVAVAPPPLPSYDYTLNNRVDIYFDPPAIYRAMEEVVASAKESIKLDFYIFGGNEAMRLAALLAAKAEAGVKVQVIVDPGLGTLPSLKRQMKQVIAYLQAHGIEVLKADLADLPPLLRNKDHEVIDHNKLIVVDDRRALIGGMNLANEFDTFHDAMVRIEGPAAGELGRQFDYDWYFDLHPQDRPRRKGPALWLEESPLSRPGLSTVRVNSTGVNRQTHRAAILTILQRAQQSIDVAMLEMGDDEIIDALILAQNRGVAVRVLLDPGEYDQLVPLIHRAPRGLVNAHAVHRLLQAGIKVHTFRTTPQQTILHEKMAVIDGQTLLVGSTNWTLKALRFNSETSVELYGGPAPQQAQTQFSRDWEQQSVPAEPPGILKRLFAWFYNYVL